MLRANWHLVELVVNITLASFSFPGFLLVPNYILGQHLLGVTVYLWDCSECNDADSWSQSRPRSQGWFISHSNPAAKETYDHMVSSEALAAAPSSPPPFFSLSHCLGKCGIFIIIDLTSDTWNVLDHNLEQIFTSLSQILHVMRTAARNCEQCHLILLYQGLLLNVTEYVLVVPTLSHKQRKRLERIQIEAMCIIVGCTRNTTSAFL